jgi:hypothetical protein
MKNNGEHVRLKKWIIASVVAFILSIVFYLVFSSKIEFFFLNRGWLKREQSLDDLDAKLKFVANQIKKVQGQGKCKDSSQCKVVGVGTKTCGLFNDFLIYSVVDADESKLLQYLEEFNRTHEKMSDKVLSVPSCGKNPVPARCNGSTCVPVM